MVNAKTEEMAAELGVARKAAEIYNIIIRNFYDGYSSNVLIKFSMTPRATTILDYRSYFFFILLAH